MLKRAILSALVLYSSIAFAGLNNVPGPVAGNLSGNAANTGFVGQHLTPVITTGQSVANGITANAGQITLSAGEWNVVCSAQFIPASTTVIVSEFVTVSTSSGVLGPANGAMSSNQATHAASLGDTLATPPVSTVSTGSTVAFCVINSSFSVSTETVSTYITATRLQ